jgi:putative DNA primase/helicase
MLGNGENPMKKKSRSVPKTTKVELKKSKPLDHSAQVRIAGEGRDEWGKRYFKFIVRGSNIDIPPFSIESIMHDNGKHLFVALGNAGWNAFTVKARNELLSKLQNRKPRDPTFKIITRLGWASGAYVFPGEIIGTPNTPLETTFSGLDYSMLGKYRIKGSLEDWRKNIAQLCVGNSRLMFALSLSFTGPILRLVAGPKAGGFQIWGEAEAGKTTAAMVAGSVWGCHRSEGRRDRGFIENWNSTHGKVELTALAHNDGLLILDETKRAGKDDKERANVVTSVAFGLAEQTEKERLTNKAPARAWRCFFLSTSNLSLSELARRGGIVIDEAHRGRLVDIPLPRIGHGLYEELHGFSSGAALSNALQHRSVNYFGTAGREFVCKLVDERRKKVKLLRRFIKNRRKRYLQAINTATREGSIAPLKRASDRFATTFAAGCLAVKYQIVPWSEGKLLKAILSCQVDQLLHGEEDEGASSPIEELRAKLVNYLAKNKARFMNLNQKRPIYGRDDLDTVAPGYRIKVGGQRWLYVTANKLKAIVGTGINARVLKRTLADEKLLEKSKDGKFVVQRRIFKRGKGRENHARVHAIKADILAK